MLGKPQRRIALGHDVEQVQTAGRQDLPGRHDAVDRAAARLGVGAERLLLQRGQAPFGVAGREAAVSHRGVVVGRLLAPAATISTPSSGVTARCAMWCSQPMSSPVSSKTAVPPAATSRSKTRPTTGFAVMPLVPSEPPQMVPTTRSDSSQGPVRAARAAAQPPSTHARPAATVARVPPGCWITRVVTGRPLARDDVGQAVAVEPLAAERHQQPPPDVRVGAQPLQHVLGVGARVAAAEADDLHVRAGWRSPRPLASALDEVHDHATSRMPARPSRAQVAPDLLRGHTAVLTAAVGEGADVVAGQVVGVHPVPVLIGAVADPIAMPARTTAPPPRSRRPPCAPVRRPHGPRRSSHSGPCAPGSRSRTAIDVVAVGEPQQPSDAAFTRRPARTDVDDRLHHQLPASPPGSAGRPRRLSSVGRWLIHRGVQRAVATTSMHLRPVGAECVSRGAQVELAGVEERVVEAPAPTLVCPTRTSVPPAPTSPNAAPSTRAARRVEDKGRQLPADWSRNLRARSASPTAARPDRAPRRTPTARPRCRPRAVDPGRAGMGNGQADRTGAEDEHACRSASGRPAPRRANRFRESRRAPAGRGQRRAGNSAAAGSNMRSRSPPSRVTPSTSMRSQQLARPRRQPRTARTTDTAGPRTASPDLRRPVDLRTDRQHLHRQLVAEHPGVGEEVLLPPNAW